MLLLISESEKFLPDSYRDAQKYSLLTWSLMQCCCYYLNLKSLIPTHTGMHKKVQLTHVILDAMLLLLSKSEKLILTHIWSHISAAYSHDPWCNAAVTIWIWKVWSWLIPECTKSAAHSHDPWCNAAVTIEIWKVWSRLLPGCTKVQLTHMILDAMLLLHMLGQQLQMAQAAWPKQHAAMLPAYKY